MSTWAAALTSVELCPEPGKEHKELTCNKNVAQMMILLTAGPSRLGLKVPGDKISDILQGRKHFSLPSEIQWLGLRNKVAIGDQQEKRCMILFGVKSFVWHERKKEMRRLRGFCAIRTKEDIFKDK